MQSAARGGARSGGPDRPCCVSQTSGPSQMTGRTPRVPASAPYRHHGVGPYACSSEWDTDTCSEATPKPTVVWWACRGKCARCRTRSSVTCGAGDSVSHRPPVTGEAAACEPGGGHAAASGPLKRSSQRSRSPRSGACGGRSRANRRCFPSGHPSFNLVGSPVSVGNGQMGIRKLHMSPSPRPGLFLNCDTMFGGLVACFGLQSPR